MGDLFAFPHIKNDFRTHQVNLSFPIDKHLIGL